MGIKSSWRLAVVVGEAAGVSSAIIWPDAPWIWLAWVTLFICTSIIIAMGLDGFRFLYKKYQLDTVKSQPTSTLEPDMDIHLAIFYVVRSMFPDRVDGAGNPEVEDKPATIEMTKKLRTGELIAWGRHMGEYGGRRLKKEDWEFKELLYLIDDVHTRPVNRETAQLSQFTALRFNRSQVEKLWPHQNPKNTERLDQLLKEGQRLLDRCNPLVGGRQWHDEVIGWINKTEEAVKNDAPNEAFIYRTITLKPTNKDRIDTCARALSGRIAELRMIIGRMQE